MLDPAITYAASSAVLIVSYYLFQSVAGTMALNRLNLMSVLFYYHLVLVSFIGAAIVVGGHGDNSVLHRIDQETRVIGWMAVCYSMIAIPLGASLAKALVGPRNATLVFNRFSYEPCTTVFSRRDSWIKIPLYALSGGCFLSAIYMVVTVGEVPQLALLKLEGHAALLMFRNNINRDFEGIYYVKSILFEQLTPIMSLIAYCYYKTTRSISDRLWFYFMMILSVNALTFSLAKSPLFAYMITFMILRIYMYGRVKWRGMIFMLGVVAMGLAFVFYFVSGNNLWFALRYFLNRLFVDQISGMFLMFKIFPEKYQFLGLSSLSRPLSEALVGQYSDPATRVAMIEAFGARAESGEMNLLSTLFVGEAWANFGLIGVIISPFYIGLLLGTFYFYIIKRKKTPITAAILAYYTFAVGVSSQFNVYLYNPVFIAVVTFLLAGIVFAHCLRNSNGSLKSVQA